jgi:hypothetical protein
VHVRLPAEAGECLAPARDAGDLRLRQLHQVTLAPRRIGPGEPQVFVMRDRVHVGDVALGHAADLDADWIDQHQPGEAARVAHRHFGGNPAAETGPHQYSARQFQCARQIEIEIRQVVHRHQPVRQ